MQHAAGDRRARGAERREPRPAGEPAGAAGDSADVRERQRGAGEEWHRPPVTGEDRARAKRGSGTRTEEHHDIFLVVLIGCQSNLLH